jgi:hypothetical protein
MIYWFHTTKKKSISKIETNEADEEEVDINDGTDIEDRED